RPRKRLNGEGDGRGRRGGELQCWLRNDGVEKRILRNSRNEGEGSAQCTSMSKSKSKIARMGKLAEGRLCPFLKIPFSWVVVVVWAAVFFPIKVRALDLARAQTGVDQAVSRFGVTGKG